MVKWIETDKHVYGAIYREHSKDFSVFASYTDIHGDDPIGTGKPQTITEWGFKDADEAIIRLIQTKENREQKDWDCEYFMAIYIKDEG